MLNDSIFYSRISQHLLNKMTITADPSGYTDRNVREAIRILEGLPAAPSSFGMKHNERRMKGLLSDYWHVHISESLLARTYNNMGRDKSDLNNSPTSEDTVQKAVLAAMVRFALSRSIPCEGLSIEEVRDAIHAYAERKQIPPEVIFDELVNAGTAIVDKSLYSRDFATGDWLLFSKDEHGTRFYLDIIPHIDAQDDPAQQALKSHLDALLQSFANG